MTSQSEVIVQSKHPYILSSPEMRQGVLPVQR